MSTTSSSSRGDRLEGERRRLAHLEVTMFPPPSYEETCTSITHATPVSGTARRYDSPASNVYQVSTSRACCKREDLAPAFRFFVQNPSNSLQFKCGTNKFQLFENEYHCFENEFPKFSKKNLVVLFQKFLLSTFFQNFVNETGIKRVSLFPHSAIFFLKLNFSAVKFKFHLV